MKKDLALISGNALDEFVSLKKTCSSYSCVAL